MCTAFAALYFTLAVGRLDERQWIAVNGGDATGKAMLTQQIIDCDRLSLQISAEHWSSINNPHDAGVNAIFFEAKYRLR